MFAVRKGTALAVQVAVMILSPVPDAGETLHQAWSLVAVQVQLPTEFTANDLDPPALGTFWFSGFTFRVQTPHGGCVTFTSLGVHPGTVMDNVAYRLEAVLFAVQVTTTFLFPVPEAGDMVHHDWLLEMDQEQPVVNISTSLPAVQSKMRSLTEMRVQPDWVRVIGTGLHPEVVQLMVATLSPQEVFVV